MAKAQGDAPSQDDAAPTRRDKRPERRALQEVVETAATAYFSTCRKLARAINRLKKG